MTWRGKHNRSTSGHATVQSVQSVHTECVGEGGGSYNGLRCQRKGANISGLTTTNGKLASSSCRCQQIRPHHTVGATVRYTTTAPAKVYHCHSNQQTQVTSIMIFLSSHPRICGPLEVSGQTRISYSNTNTHSSPQCTCHMRGWVYSSNSTDVGGWMGVAGHMMRSSRGELSAGKGGLKVIKGGLKVIMYPHLGSEPASGHSRVRQLPLGRGFAHHRHGLSSWTRLANGEGCCPPLCGPCTRQLFLCLMDGIAQCAWNHGLQTVE